MNNEVICTVLDSEPVERSGEFDGRDGEKISYTTRKQKAKLEVGGFAYPYDVRLEDGQKPYATGRYQFDIASMMNVNKGVASLGKFTVLSALPGAK